MGKLIKFPGSGQFDRPKVPDAVPTPEVGLKVNLDKYAALLKALSEQYLPQIPGHRKAHLLKENLTVVSGYTPEELVGWVENSTAVQWQERPMFFSAICKEISKRNLF